jgi:hypothetical protein
MPVCGCGLRRRLVRLMVRTAWARRRSTARWLPPRTPVRRRMARPRPGARPALGGVALALRRDGPAPVPMAVRLPLVRALNPCQPRTTLR